MVSPRLKSVRYVFFDLTRCVLLTLANIYPPNNDNPNVFRVLFDHLYSFKSDEIIISNFNLVLDINEKERKNGIARTHQNALKVVQNAMENLELCNVQRVLNPESKRFAWRQRQPDVHADLIQTSLQVSKLITQ